MFLVFSRFFAHYVCIAVCNNESRAKEIMTTVGGDTYVHNDTMTVNDDNSEYIYIAEQGPELYFMSFNEQDTQNYIDENSEDGPYKMNLSKRKVDELFNTDFIKNYVDLVKTIGLKPMSFTKDTNGTVNTIDCPVQNV